MAKTISDEQIIAALMENPTQRAAAEACGLSERALYDRMTDDEFIALYRQTKTDLLRSTLQLVAAKMGEAVNVIAEIMQSPETPPAVRLQAARELLRCMDGFLSRLNEDEATAARLKKSHEMDKKWGFI